MTEPRLSRPITVTQVVGVLALVLILLFIAAFASKAVETYRLRAWLDEMEGEIAALERTRDALEIEKQRRESQAWVDQALKEAGRVPPDVLAVRVVTPEGAARVTPPAPTRETAPGFVPRLPERPQAGPLLDNPNWKAWMSLLFGRE